MEKSNFYTGLFIGLGGGLFGNVLVEALFRAEESLSMAQPIDNFDLTMLVFGGVIFFVVLVLVYFLAYKETK